MENTTDRFRVLRYDNGVVAKYEYCGTREGVLGLDSGKGVGLATTFDSPRSQELYGRLLENDFE